MRPTGASIHEATGYPVAVAFNAGNLRPVAKAMREKFPKLPLILCADDDSQTEGNPGLTKATEAARAVGGLLAIPDFGTDRDPDMTDMNDLAQICGGEAIERAIANASAPARGEPQPGEENAPAGEYARDVNLIRASDVTPEPITWLWNGWLAAGKMHVFGGAPGTGKTTISMGLAATVTTGGRWPDGTRSIAGNVVIWTGDGAAVNRWLAAIREHKAEIIEALQVGAGDMATASRWWLIHYPDRDPLEVACCPEATNADILERHPDAVAAEPFTPTIRQPFVPMSPDEEQAIRAWLELIEETDPATIADVVSQCQRDADVRDYFTKRAAAELPKPEPFPDDRRTCDQCANLIARRCQAAKRGEIVAGRSYEPIRDVPRRCEGYAPGADDPDRRQGRERWPGLIQKEGE